MNITRQGIWYYDEASREVIFLGEDLLPDSRLRLPEDTVGSICVAPDWETVYYCTDNGVRALDMHSGIPRLVKETSSRLLGIRGSFFDAQALLIATERAEGKEEYALITSENGSIISRGDKLPMLISGAAGYFTR